MVYNAKGDLFPDKDTLERAKHSGNGFIRVTHPTGLPTPYQLTKDERWEEAGKLHEEYYLDLEGGNKDSDVSSDDKVLNPSLNTMDESYGIDNKQLSDDTDEPVKVLRPIPHKEVMKMIRESSENQKKCDPNETEVMDVNEEFGKFMEKHFGDIELEGLEEITM